MPAERTPMPPVRLHSDAELAREALAAPLFARAVRLARWTGPDTRTGAAGELIDAQLPEAALALGLSADPEGQAQVSEAWRVALDAGLVEIRESGAPQTTTAEGAPPALSDADEGPQLLAGAAAGAELALICEGGPSDVLEVWLAALDTVLAEAAVPDLDGLMDAIDEGGTVDLGALGWDPRHEAELLDSVLANLYLLTVSEGGAGDGPVPLPVLAASMVVPDDMGEPTDDVLEQVSDAMMRLDEQLRLLEPIGLLAYRPVDEELMAEAADTEAATVEEEDISRYGLVRLTPLGLYGVRARMVERGIDAPAVGELVGKGADALLDSVARFPEAAAQAEIEQWLVHREASAAAAELLAAARGGDELAPLRRLRCQQALALAGASAEPAVRAVLDDPELGGLARVWLVEGGAADVPPPSEELVFWLTIDTLAAQLATDAEASELITLMESLTGGQLGFFDTAWRVAHPATAEVLEAMGRLHPDRKAAKEARKAAFKARSRQAS
ncbi:hypothetical protein [Streptomyces sp. NPDC006879]|uniref:hypothetical protein n=1 Tax=Streptomyces sp. NPDC006879 TaxID=3364767 RepID=UPI0036D0B5DF